ncbi:GNAT family N-acetyltransferase [Streptomyces iconiensis]|uniref:GNAT family N-acetyltransferase n=1 Tax=Streptomyces iconiensis TaxID=1384038 RepID=A0ABT7A9P7_9ACTN|nr:GNAT family N-acetyltransferase [Streptomyces iconiensis]MDJ1138082.1 GNAT family N-acetyltransferase [Streptomyces iconiensis]
MDRLAKLLDTVARGGFPPPDGSLTVLPQPSPRDAGVLALTGRSVVFADADPGRIRGLLPPGDLGAALGPPFLTALCAAMGREAGSIDVLLALPPGAPVGRFGPGGLATSAGLAETDARAHPRVARALAHRDDVRVWEARGGTVLTGRGVTGRWEVAVEVDEAARGAGLGRQLAAAARGLVPANEVLWAQVAPGNAASLRAFLAVGFLPVGAEVLLSRPGGTR